MGPSGDFDIDGREFRWDVEHIETYEGDEYAGGEMDDYIHEADRVFYHVVEYENEEGGGGEEYYRWLGGPFEGWDDVEAAIIDEVEVYA